MSAPQRLPALRVKLPCQDEKEFFARIADTIAEKGLRIPSSNLRPVGTRIRLVLEFRNAQSVTGEGVVDAHVAGARPTMNIRILRFERSQPGAGPAPGQAAAAAPAQAVTPAPAEPVADAPAAAARPPAPETSFASLFEEGRKTPAPTAGDDIPRPPPDDTRQLEPLHGEGAAPAPPGDAAREVPPEPTPGPARASAAAREEGALPAASRRAIVAAAIAATVLVVAVLAYSFARGPSSPAVPPPPAPAAPAALDTRLADGIALADARLSEGRLAGPDGALDHLLAAKALAPDDPRVKERLALLADTLEKLGARALERGDVAEAEVHLAAALQAAPDRASVREKLDSLARVPKAPADRARDPAAPAEGK